jgi:hypothetical protein
MDGCQATYVFKLRRNIALEGDLALARIELDALIPGVGRDTHNIVDLVRDMPQLGRLRGLAAVDSNTRPSGAQAVILQGPLTLLPDLIRRLSFVQRIYCIVPDAAATRAWLSELDHGIKAVSSHQVEQDSLVIQAIPHYALIEISDVVARRSASAKETGRSLDEVLAAWLGRLDEPRAVGLAQTALAARSTTSHLFHDVHYYKAKFFPRLARSMLNVCAQALGDGPHRVIDPFVGSGTTLLEAATLGIPSVGVDIDPLSALISSAKLGATRLDSGLLTREVERVADILDAHENGRGGSLNAMPLEQSAITFPAWLLKNRRMTPRVAVCLSDEIRIVQAAVAGCSPQVRPLLRVLMSDAISRRIRMRFLGTGVGRFSLTLAKTPAPRILARSLKRHLKALATFEWLCRTVHLRLAEAHVVEADARRLPGSLGAFDMVVTSPPYLPASSGRESYARARAPSLIALGMRGQGDVDLLANASIGSMDGKGAGSEELTHAERHLVEWLQRDPLRALKAGPTARYFVDMRHSFGEMMRVLRPGGMAVVVSGKQSTFYNFATREALYVARSADLLAEEAEKAGLVVRALHDVQLLKSNVNARPRSLDSYYETLIVLRKPG